MLINNKNIEVITFGCRLNIFESEVIKDQLNSLNAKSIIIINTCSVTSEAERKAKQSIRKVKKLNPDTKILVTGCAAQINPEKWFSMPEVNYVIGNKEKVDKDFWVNFLKKEEEEKNNIIVSDIMSLKESSFHLVKTFNQKTRCFLQIQNGCDHRCTFCIIPYGRGNSRSVKTENVIQNIRLALSKGMKEIVLTGVDLTSWGKDLGKGESLGILIKSIFKLIPKLPRLRVSSIDPAEIDHDFMDVLQNEERLMPHLHLSIQHGDDLILKRMKRRHLFRDVINFVEESKRRRPDVIFGGDFISGFPSENYKAHQNTIKLIKEADIKFAHVFPFSQRPGTPASKMKMLSKTIISNRSRELRELSKKNIELFLNNLIGSSQRVLIENHNSGYSPQFVKVQFDQKIEPGKIVNANIVKSEKFFLRATLK